MADDGEDGKKFVFIKILHNGEKEPSNTSNNYTGKGEALYPNGDSYSGSYADGKRDGKGIYRYFATGEIYNGDWVQNFKHGIGKKIY
jgi:hypothetical protein